jgi:glycosyltransferase involved in cell wall biosynthesis
VSRAEVAQHLQRSGIFVLASVEEGLALVIAQAMACGLPVIATDATGASELITDGVEGIVVPSRDVEALTEALERLLSDTDAAMQMGRAGRERVESLGGWSSYGNEIAHEITRVAASSGGRP